MRVPRAQRWQAGLGKGWRVFATGLSFVLFGLGGAAIALMMYAFVYPAPLAKEKKRACARAAVSRTFRLFIALMRGLGLLSYELRGQERLRPGQLVIANHPSLLDVVFLIALIENANCIVKSSLWRNPFTRGPVTAAGYIANDHEQLIAACAASLRSGDALIVFPEGTRSRPGRPLKFLRGTAHVALAADCDITPVLIRCEPATLLKRQKWYRVPDQVPHFTVEILPDISIAPYRAAAKTTPGRAARELTTVLERFYHDRYFAACP
ncbi:MAG TPA: 1-acyl-sn-glycerol-3-phosphate acyltransferase [Gammaproteobacteria bacterium]|nr:1-acyl-sn-glycerol-3-phosphate acyltransferase [Gammaproteobacteria bacterium]